MCARLAGRDQRIHGHANIVTLGHFGDKKAGKILYVCEKQDFSSKKLVRTEKKSIILVVSITYRRRRRCFTLVVILSDNGLDLVPWAYSLRNSLHKVSQSFLASNMSGELSRHLKSLFRGNANV